jgi:propanol-preferring alcohol dehydrogenase
MASGPVTYEIPKTFKAAVYGEYRTVKNLFKQLILLKDNPGQISTHVEELPVPEPGPGQVLVRLTVSSKTASQVPTKRRY